MRLHTIPFLITLTSLGQIHGGLLPMIMQNSAFLSLQSSLLHLPDKTRDGGILEQRSPTTSIPNPLPPNYEGSNPEGENPMGTAPCGTYATTATDGPCGAWFTAQYSITPSRQLPTTLITTRTATLSLPLPEVTE
ncbi:hypothetical protein XPA_000681 [Xanthoria parietina]